MDIYLLAFCLLPLFAIIFAAIVIVREKRGSNRRAPWAGAITSEDIEDAPI
jgi:hypothetical protein